MTVSSVAQSGLAVSKEIKTMGIYAVDNPGRAGYDVKEFDGWRMYAIINHFVNAGQLDVEYERIRLRRALLISAECSDLARGARINV